MMKNTIKSILALALVALGGMQTFAGGTGTVSSWSIGSDVSGAKTQDGNPYTIGVTALQYSSANTHNLQPGGPAWYAGIEISWNTSTSYNGRDTTVSFSDNTGRTVGQYKASKDKTGGDNSPSGCGIGLTTTTKWSGILPYLDCVESTSFWTYITPEKMYELFKAGKNYRGTMLMGGKTFNIDIPNTITMSASSVQWYPAVALNSSNKVYGDVAQMATDKGTFTFVADATASRADFTVTDGTTFDLNGKTLTVSTSKTMYVTGGVIKNGTLAVNGGKIDITGGTFSFKPDESFIHTGYSAKESGSNWVVTKDHTHQWTFTLNGATLTATCTEQGTDCDVPGRKTAIELTVSGGSDGVAPTFAIANTDTFLGYVNKEGTIVTIGTTYTVTRLTDDGANYDKWYVGNYKVECDVNIAGEGVKTLVKEFSIAKPSGGYAKNGWIAGSRDVRYDSWPESLAAASDGDTVYYKGDDRAYKQHEFSVGNKNITLDFGGKTLKYTSGDEGMTLKNAGTGTLTFQNVTIQQPKCLSVSYQISAVGNIQFGTGVKATNQATNKDRYLKITASDGTLIVTDGQYECSFAGTYKLRGGQYKSKYGEPTADTAAGYIVRTVSSGDYDRDIVYHEHHIVYSAEGNVISATCNAQDHEYCGFGTKTATLNAPDKNEDGEAYSLASIAYSDGFPSQTGTITYYSGETQISAPTKFGSYTAKTTIGGATAVKAFQIIHIHNFVYDKNDDAGTITARCTTTPDCDFNKNPRIATLTAQNSTYTGFEQDLASTKTNTSDFPTTVTKTYSCGSTPVDVGNYTATMTVGDTSVTKNFSITAASMGSISASMTSPSLNFTGNEQQNTLGSATLGSYNLTSGDYDLSGVTKATGSGYSNCTYKVTLTAKGGNFTGTKEITWTINAPSTEFANNALGRFDYEDYGGNYGEAGARSLTVTDSTKLIFINGTWAAGLTVQPPMTDGWTIGSSFWVGVENLRTSLSTLPKTYTGTEVSENAVAPWLTLSTERWGLTDYYYVGHVKGLFNITPQMVEDASKDGKESVDFTMMAGGIAWSPDSGDHNWDGVKYTDFKLIMPVANAVFAVRAGETANIGATVLAAAKIRLGVGATVTTTQQQTKGQIYTEEAGYQVYESEDAGTYTYSCVAIPKVTILDAKHQTAKVVKVGDTEITGTDNVYAVDYNSTVTVTYTLAAGYETTEPTKTVKDIKGDMTIEAPTVTATSYTITYVLGTGGVNNPANPANYTVESDTITLAAPSRAGYTFAGWAEGSTIAKGSTGNKTFTANWKVITYTICYRDAADSAEVLTAESYTIETGSSYNLTTVPTRDNCTVVAWLTDPKGESESSVTSFEISAGTLGNKTFYARYTVQSIPADPTKPDSPSVVIPQDEIAKAIGGTEGKTTDQIMLEMSIPSNGVTKVERYVLGLDMQDMTDVPVALPVQTAEKLVLAVGNIAPKEAKDVNAEVRYSLVTADTPEGLDEADPGAQQEEPAFEVDLPAKGVKYYRVKIDLVKPASL